MGNEIADRYYMGLIGYNNSLNLGFGGELQGHHQVPVSMVGNHPLRVETRLKKTDDGAGGLVEQKVSFPVWLDPVASGKTRMREALEVATKVVADFVASLPESYPPIVINITDGVPTDATEPDFPEVEAASQALRSITNKNGSNALLFNIHLSSESAAPISFPSDEAQLSDRYSKLLFRMSSPLTEEMCRIAVATESDIVLTQGARGFVFQGDLVSVIKLLDIGTRVGTNR